MTRALAAFAAFAAWVAACSSGTLEATGSLDGSSDAPFPPATDAAAEGGVTPDCPDAGAPATTLACTGLYASFATKEVAASAQAYAPATPLWSDGAQKSRWIELPPATTIDVTDPNEWTFPVGTKLFKEFRVDGKRVETRMFQKVKSDYWVYATYAWSADDTDAPISYGATVPVGTDGGTWVIPTPDDCDNCHRGRSDRILGFEQVGLGLAGATGLTLAQLVAQGLVTPPPASVNLKIGDDGSGLDAPALGWLHVNCGVTCHNANPGASGYGAGMLLRLDPTLLDGGAVTSSWDPIRTTENVPCISGSVQGMPRIVPGDSAASVIIQLVSERGTLQMPPVGSRVVDTTDVATVASWIEHIPVVAGVPDAGVDSGIDAGTDAGGSPDASSEDASAPDAGAPDANDSGLDATLASDASEDAGEDGGAPPAADASDATISDAGLLDASDDAAD